MSVDILQHHPDPRSIRRAPAIPSGVFGMLAFVACEVMFFAGLISAFTIIKSAVRGGVWPPPGQPRLPVEATGFNSLVLIASGVLLVMAERANRTPGQEKNTTKFMAGALIAGLFFVGFQGFEWIGLISEGLTLQSSSHGSFFYMIIGSHALHAVAAIIALAYVLKKHMSSTMKHSELQTALVFWLFVVGIWPVLYWLVYL